MYNKDLKGCVYVCPHCFNILKNCLCNTYPETLLHMDKKIHPLVLMFNMKGYQTTGCCEGHIENKNACIYIMLKKPYKFENNPPKGVTYTNGTLKAEILGDDVNARTRYKNKMLKIIYSWICNLEDINMGKPYNFPFNSNDN